MSLTYDPSQTFILASFTAFYLATKLKNKYSRFIALFYGILLHVAGINLVSRMLENDSLTILSQFVDKFVYTGLMIIFAIVMYYFVELLKLFVYGTKKVYSLNEENKKSILEVME